MSIIVNVVDQKMHTSSTMKSIVAGSQNFVKFRFNLSEDWDGLMTFAQFQQDGLAYNQYLDDNYSAYLPTEIKAGKCIMMLYGVNENTIATTNYLTLIIDENALVVDANSTEISESLYNQLVTQVNALNGRIDSIISLPEGGTSKETDPTVPAWAKEPKKPAYTAAEVGAISQEDLQAATDAALSQAKESGLFDGKPGKDGVDGQDGLPGKDGKDGITPHIGENGNWYLGDTDTGIPSNGEKGEKGERGDIYYPSLYIDDNGYLHVQGAEDNSGVTFTLNEETGHLEVAYD